MSAMKERLDGRTILITGASSGIGQATAMEFARTVKGGKLKLVITARRLDNLVKLADEITRKAGEGVRVHAVRLDVSRPDEVSSFVGQLPDEFRDIDVLVNNAGLAKGTAQAPDIPASDISDMMLTNVTGLVNMTQAILPIFKARGDKGGQGDIVNIGSVAGRAPYAGGSIYCASKAAVRSFTEALRKELVKTRIRVIEVDPGKVLTEFSLVRYSGDVDKANAVYKDIEPLTPQDIAEVIVFAVGRRENVVVADTLVFPNHQCLTSQPQASITPNPNPGVVSILHSFYTDVQLRSYDDLIANATTFPSLRAPSFSVANDPTGRQTIRAVFAAPAPISAHEAIVSGPEAVIDCPTASMAQSKPCTTVLYASTTIEPRPRPKIVHALYRLIAYIGTFVVVSIGLGTAFFIYDATTYREDPDAGDIPISELALHPRRGGPKNLPIIEHQVDDDESADKKNQKHKPKLVILGSGWGSIALVKNLNAQGYHVTVVSPSNYFLFTPMLPSATVGTLELRSLVEPVRKIVLRARGHFLKAAAEDVEFNEKLVEVSAVGPTGEKEHFYLPYDKLVIGVGSITNPHGVKGLEHCHFLKDISDARMIRNKIISNLESACLPTTPDHERKRLLSFVISGGGPTGVEFAAELYDMLNEDLGHYYPKILRNEISVHVIQSRGHVLNTYDEALSRFAEARFAHDQVDVHTNARVQEVQPDRIIFTQNDESGNAITKEIPQGFCLWSTGVSQTEFCQRLAKKLTSQTNRHALETDTHLRLCGAPIGDVYAIGDCSTVQNNVSDHIMSFVRSVAWEKGSNGPANCNISYSEWRALAKRVKHRFPQAADHLRRVDRLFEQYDADKSGTLDFNELSKLLKQIDNKLTSLPATAQRANQQGIYLARKFNKLAQAEEGMRLNEMEYGDLDDAVYKPFAYHHMGSLAYIGNAAIFDFNGLSFSGGLLAVYLWRSIYFAQSVSLRTRILLAMDWTKRALFGRDMMNY